MIAWRLRALSTSGLALVLFGTIAIGTSFAQGTDQEAEAQRALLDRYCVTCHNDRLETGDLSLEGVDVAHPETDPALWEAVLRKLRAGAMPPQPRPRPGAASYAGLIGYLEAALDQAAAASPNPGRTPTFRRLSRTEYQNAIRDLLDLDVDVTALLPRDDVTFGFDNVNAGALSPTLMERYLAASQKVSELAVGSRLPAPGSRVVIVPADRTQERHVDGLPFGTRGGTLVEHMFPADGEYEIRVRLQRNRNENVEGLTEPHDMEITLDGVRLDVFTTHLSENWLMRGNAAYYSDVGIDNHLNVRVRVTAGPHRVGAAFIQKNSAVMETTRQPYDAAYNMDRHPRQQPAVRSIAIVGPFDPTGVGDTPSRARIFSCRSETADAAVAEECATSIIATLARRAYRRPVTVDDLDQLVAFYRQGHASVDFEAGVEMALRALLASPEFLFRIERDPEAASPGTPYRISDVELASRLSFFLWSSIPDEELLSAAEAGRLSDGETLHAQVRRMLADPRAEMLTTNFAGQWLHLRNLDAVQPDARLFPDFDDNLRQGFRRETELLFRSILEEKPKRRRPADRRLHVRQRTGGAALWLPRHLWRPLPAARPAGGEPADGPAGSRQHPDGHLVRHADLAGAPRQVDPRDAARHTASTPAAERAGARRDSLEHADRLDAGEDGAAPPEPAVCCLPPDHGSGRAVDGELRRDRAVA